jgi:predicted enzyme related to lactoylglutathione lyase
MPQIKNHAPGAFCWAEVGTVNAAKTKSFYGELFGWKYEDKPAGEFGVYTMCKSGGKDLAGLYELPPNLVQAGVPPHWMSYVAVASADDACKKISKHGGKIQQGPFDVMDVGRMAICEDPTGAIFSIWEAKAHSGCGVMGESGTPSWFELATKAVEKAEKFYGEVFGWTFKKSSDAGFVYREITGPGSPYPQGGMMELTPQHGPVPSHWMIYFTVEDCDGQAQRAKTLGGKVVLPPMDIPKVGRFSILSDPAGATFAVIKMSMHCATPGAAPMAAPMATKEEPKAKKAAAPAAPSAPTKPKKK